MTASTATVGASWVAQGGVRDQLSEVAPGDLHLARQLLHLGADLNLGQRPANRLADSANEGAVRHPQKLDSHDVGLGFTVLSSPSEPIQPFP
jgi:hypothetical protein